MLLMMFLVFGIANKFTMANYDFKEVIIYGELIEILNKYFC